MKLSKRAMKFIRPIYGAVFSLMLVVTAVLFILSAVGINASGDSPYTYASVGAAFGRICIPVYITLALAVLGGIFFTFVAPDGNLRVRPPKDLGAQLTRALRTADLSAAPARIREKIRFERRLRASLRLANAVYLLVGLVFALLCAINPANYHEGVDSHALTASVVNVVYAAVIYLVPPALMALLRLAIDALSYEYELKLVRALPKCRPTAKADSPAKGRILLAARLVLTALAVVFIVLGVINGGMEDVVQKAVKICTECIGLG